MIHSESLELLTSALVKFQAEVGVIPKTATNPFFKSKYADLATAKSVADPIATKHGLAVSQFPATGDQLLTLLVHESGQFLGEYMDMHLIKNDPQSGGSAITYARRYAYLAALGLVADEDDDANKATRPPAKPDRPLNVAVYGLMDESKDMVRQRIAKLDKPLQERMKAFFADQNLPKLADLSVEQLQVVKVELLELEGVA